MLLLLALLYGGPLTAHISNGADPNQFADDARAWIVPFDHYHDARLLSNDYVGDYLLATMPVGYRLLYSAAASLGDPRGLSKVLPYLLLFISLLAVGWAAARLGGLLAAATALSLMLGSDLFLVRMAGGMPRAFAYPIIACGLLAMVQGKMVFLAAMVLIGAAFYPVTAVILGSSMAFILLILPARDRGSALGWSLKRRLALLGLTAALAGLLLLPIVLSTRAYGPVIDTARARTFEEYGPNGRYNKNDRPPYPGLHKTFSTAAVKTFFGRDKPLTPMKGWFKKKASRANVLLVVLFLLVLPGWGLLLFKRPEARRFSALLLAALGGSLVSKSAAPYLYLPWRYALYTVPLMAVIMLPTGFTGLGILISRKKARPLLEWLVPGALCLMMVLALGGRGDARAGLTVRLPREQKIYRKIAELPADSLIAGWPTGVMDNVPYVSRRTAFITYETHQVFHLDFLKEMRHRMGTLIDAYFATSPGPLKRLRELYGVTHLLVNLRHLRGRAPYYLSPFDHWAKKAMARARGKKYEILRQLRRASIFRRGDLALLELARIAGG